jgi:hypothetical protein
LRLPVDELGGRFGAVAKQITSKIFCDLLRNGLGIFADRVKHDVSEPRKRHVPRVDRLALRIPFRRNGCGECRRGRDKSAPSRCQDRFAIERYSDTVLRID